MKPEQDMFKPSRRDILKAGITGGATLLIPNILQPSSPDWVPPPEFTKGNYALPIRHVDTDQPYVSLTFDDGYFPDELEKILRFSQETGLTFTLFPIGILLTANPDLWREAKKNGHEIGNHSHLHRDVSQLTPGQIDWEFRTFEEEDYPEVFNEPFSTPGYARVPLAQGPVNETVQRVIYQLEDLHVHWQRDSYSWKRLGSDPKFLLNNVSRAEAGDIVVLHIVERDVDMLPRYIDALTKKGLTHVPFSTLWNSRIQEQPEQKLSNVSRRSFFLAALPHKEENRQQVVFTQERLQTPETGNRPDIVFGVYLPYNILPSRNLSNFQDYVLNNGVNSVVIDIKNEAGRVNIPFDHPNKPDIQPDYMDNPDNVRSFLDWATQHNIYVIGRQVVLADTRFAKANPTLALHDQLGHAWIGGDKLWANPFTPEVADYNATIARAGADFGFKEIMFDYVRFPAGDTDIAQIAFTGPYTPQGRITAITDIIRAAHEKLIGSSTRLTAVFFGYTAWGYQGEMGVGQSLEAVAPYLDGLSPMAYPDLYGSGITDCPDLCIPAPLHPYEILYYTTAHARERLLAINPNILVTPWIQAYNNINHRSVRFSQEDIDKQMQGAFAAHADGVLAWNPSLQYSTNLYT